MPSIARARRLRTAADPPAHPAMARAKFDGRRPRNVTSSAWLSPRCADVPRLRISRAATFRLDCSRSGKISGWLKALYDPAYPPLARCCFAARAEAILPPARKRERPFGQADGSRTAQNALAGIGTRAPRRQLSFGVIASRTELLPCAQDEGEKPCLGTGTFTSSIPSLRLLPSLPRLVHLHTN